MTERLVYLLACCIERLWRLLPDRCSQPGCCRKGVRGNENTVGYNQIDEPIYACDYCHAEMIE